MEIIRLALTNLLWKALSTLYWFATLTPTSTAEQASMRTSREWDQYRRWWKHTMPEDVSPSGWWLLHLLFRLKKKKWTKVIKKWEKQWTQYALWWWWRWGFISTNIQTFQQYQSILWRMTFYLYFQNCKSYRPLWHSPCTSKCGSKRKGFESHQSYFGFFVPDRLVPSVGTAVGPMGRLGPHTRASSTSWMRLRGCCFNYSAKP